MRNNNKYELFLYGKTRPYSKAVAYCELHKCYLEPIDIKEKRCNYKKCKNLKNL